MKKKMAIKRSMNKNASEAAGSHRIQHAASMEVLASSFRHANARQLGTYNCASQNCQFDVHNQKNQTCLNIANMVTVTCNPRPALYKRFKEKTKQTPHMRRDGLRIPRTPSSKERRLVFVKHGPVCAITRILLAHSLGESCKGHTSTFREERPDNAIICIKSAHAHEHVK